MTVNTTQIKTRDELAKWSGAELFAYALTHGLSNGQRTGADPGLKLGYSFCYGCGYSDTKFWTIPYTLDDNGFPAFDEQSKETLTMILAGEHLTAWNALKAAKGDEKAARKAHESFMAS